VTIRNRGVKKLKVRTLVLSFYFILFLIAPLNPAFVVERCEVQCRSKAVGQCNAVQQLFMLLVVLLTAGAGCCYWPHCSL